MELISWFALRSGFYSPLCSKYTTQFTLRTLIFLTLSTRASIIVERLVYLVWNVYVSRFVGVECFRLAWARMELTRYWMLNVGLGPGGDHQVLNVGLGPGGAHQVLNVEFFWYDYAQPHLKGCYFVLLSGTASNMHAVSSWGSHFPHARGRIFKGSS